MISHFFSSVNLVITKLKINESGFRIITNNGRDSNQEVPHFHIHLLAGENLKGIR